jgi:hypothetical protein
MSSLFDRRQQQLLILEKAVQPMVRVTADLRGRLHWRGQLLVLIVFVLDGERLPRPQSRVSHS